MKVTEVPAQTGFALADTATATDRTGLTVIVPGTVAVPHTPERLIM